VKQLGKALLFVTLVALPASAALAEEPAWTYVEAGYLSIDPDNLSDSGDNWFAGGSVGFLKNFHVFGKYVDGDFSTNVEQTYWEFGAGWHGLLGDKADIVGEVSWVDGEVNNQGDDGYQLTGGVRWLPVTMFELDGFINWADYDVAGSDTSYEVRAILNIWVMGFGASYEMADTADQWNVFARFNFGMR
jgi:hypothetical protein